MPKIAVADELKRGELIRLAWNGPDIPIEARMIFHRDKWLSPPLAALEKLITTEIASKVDYS
ncbi:MAG: Transcriptional regulator, LysR family [Sporomusa sp.]|nr:Transcriptional regulator, LysR family [Sporomusa sp.]